MSGQIGQPAACMIENNAVLSRIGGLKRRAIMACGGRGPTGHALQSGSKAFPGCSNPLLLWTTLWATSVRRRAGRDFSEPALVCSNFGHGKTFENQPLAST
ncbi:MAG: hypothetical protein AB1430_11640 [Pseudomonadota bacterium]